METSELLNKPSSIQPSDPNIKFRDLHQKSMVQVDIENILNPDALPAPFIVSKKNSKNPIENKFIVSITNTGHDKLIIGGPNSTGIYVNFSDLMNPGQMENISVSSPGVALQAKLSKPLISLIEPLNKTHEADEHISAQNSPAEIVKRDLTKDPKQIPLPNNTHLGNEWILFIWPEKEIELKNKDCFLIQFENVISDFFPALRYIDISWDLKQINFRNKTKTIKHVEGFQQLAIELCRPADYVSPPFPLKAAWLENNNKIYTSKDFETLTLYNELSLTIINEGMHDFELDVSKHSRGVPYFELIMVGTDEGDKNIDFSSAVAASQDLVLAQLTDTTSINNTGEYSYLNELWRINKFIQGPIVKWEIKPDLELEAEKLKFLIGNRDKRTLLGKGVDGILTFKISHLFTRLPEGVALVYLRYFNMAEHDDGQLVLFIEKKNLLSEQTLIPSLKGGENMFPSPLNWKVEENKSNGKLKTVVTIGTTVQVDSGSGIPPKNTERKEQILPLELKIKGNVKVSTFNSSQKFFANEGLDEKGVQNKVTGAKPDFDFPINPFVPFGTIVIFDKFNFKIPDGWAEIPADSDVAYVFETFEGSPHYPSSIELRGMNYAMSFLRPKCSLIVFIGPNRYLRTVHHGTA